MAAYYSGWREATHDCPRCSWQGTGAELKQVEMYREVVEMGCPRCSAILLVLAFPTLEESRANWDKVSPGDRMVVEWLEARLLDIKGRSLRSADQLPDLPDGPIVVLWDIETRDGGDTILRVGDQVLWREPAYYEGYERFAEVVALLSEKYGDRLQDVEPTPLSFLYLYGDRLGAPFHVENVRERLRAGAAGAPPDPPRRP